MHIALLLVCLILLSKPASSFGVFFSFIGRKGLKQAARVTVAVVVALAAAVVAKRERLTHQT